MAGFVPNFILRTAIGAALLALLLKNWFPTMTNSHNNHNTEDPFLIRDVLPINVRPVNYQLTLAPKFEDFTFEGHAIIKYVLYPD
jgi:hypothetical protein